MFSIGLFRLSNSIRSVMPPVVPGRVVSLLCDCVLRRLGALGGLLGALEGLLGASLLTFDVSSGGSVDVDC